MGIDQLLAQGDLTTGDCPESTRTISIISRDSPGSMSTLVVFTAVIAIGQHLAPPGPKSRGVCASPLYYIMEVAEPQDSLRRPKILLVTATLVACFVVWLLLNAARRAEGRILLKCARPMPRLILLLKVRLVYSFGTILFSLAFGFIGDKIRGKRSLFLAICVILTAASLMHAFVKEKGASISRLVAYIIVEAAAAGIRVLSQAILSKVLSVGRGLEPVLVIFRAVSVIAYFVAPTIATSKGYREGHYAFYLCGLGSFMCFVLWFVMRSSAPYVDDESRGTSITGTALEEDSGHGHYRLIRSRGTWLSLLCLAAVAVSFACDTNQWVTAESYPPPKAAVKLVLDKFIPIATLLLVAWLSTRVRLMWLTIAALLMEGVKRLLGSSLGPLYLRYLDQSLDFVPIFILDATTALQLLSAADRFKVRSFASIYAATITSFEVGMILGILLVYVNEEWCRISMVTRWFPLVCFLLVPLIYRASADETKRPLVVGV